MHPNDPSYQKPVYQEPKMFYVIKSRYERKYAVDGNGIGFDLGSFEKAMKWSNYHDAKYDLDGLENVGNLIVVGPCEEGEEP